MNVLDLLRREELVLAQRLQKSDQPSAEKRGFGVEGVWFMVDGRWCVVDGLWLMVYGSWFMVRGLELRV